MSRSYRYLTYLKELNRTNYGLFLRKLWRRLLAPIKAVVFNLRKKDFTYDNTYVIFSEARGGSTWVMEQLQMATNGISIFEPLWGKHGAFKSIAGQFSSPFYFGHSSSECLLRNFLKATMRGEKASWRTLQFNEFRPLINSSAW